MDIPYQVEQMRIVSYQYTPKRLLKQTASACVSLINGFGIGIEEVAKLQTGRRDLSGSGNFVSDNPRGLDFGLGFYAD